MNECSRCFPCHIGRENITGNGQPLIDYRLQCSRQSCHESHPHARRERERWRGRKRERDGWKERETERALLSLSLRHTLSPLSLLSIYLSIHPSIYLSGHSMSNQPGVFTTPPRIFLKFFVHKLHAKLGIKVKISAAYLKI